MFGIFSRKIYTVGDKKSGGLYTKFGFVGILVVTLVITSIESVAAANFGPLIALVFVFILVFPVLLSNGKGQKVLGARKYIGNVTGPGSQFAACVLMNDIGDKGYATDIVARGTGWETYDVMFKPTESAAEMLRCYTIFEASLVRISPHLLFDAKQAQGQQFKALYSESQRLSLEGDFDTYFDLYSPDHYQIDTLSFITPEVMQAFMVLKDYDAEIIADRVLVYAPLLDEGELAEFQTRCQELAKQLNDNLSRYLDSFVPSKQAGRETMPFARRLLKNPWHNAAYAVGGFVLLLVLSISAAVARKPEYFVFIAFLLVGWSYPAREFISTLRYNHRQKQLFYSDLRVMQERGRY